MSAGVMARTGREIKALGSRKRPSAMCLRGVVDGAPRRVRLDVLVSETHTPRGAGFPILLRPSRPTPGADIQAGPDRARTLSSRLPTASFASTTVRAVVLRGTIQQLQGTGISWSKIDLCA